MLSRVSHGGPSITLPCGRDADGMPFGLQMLGAMRGDERLLAAAKAVEAHFESSKETARPIADMENLASSTVDLRSIVTHPPVWTVKKASKAQPLRTAV